MNNIEVDAKDVLNMFASLDSKKLRASYRNALRTASNILTKEARHRLSQITKSKGATKKTGKTLKSGIKTVVDKEASEAKVHIMGDFRLKFFEMGTKERHLKSNGASRGRMPKDGGYYFFLKSREAKEREIEESLERLINESILKVANK